MTIQYGKYKVNDFNYFQKHFKNKKNFEIVYDIETFTSNRKVQRTNPSEMQSFTYSFAFTLVSKNNEIFIYHFTTFIDFLTYLKKYVEKNIIINLIAHNNFKYDAHFLRYELVNRLGFKVANSYVRNVTKKLPNTILNKDIENHTILEKRVKSSTNLDFIAFYDNIKIQHKDTVPRTNSSLKTIGKKLLNLGLIEEQYLKTDYDYLKYDLDEKITDSIALNHSKRIFLSLTSDERAYIYNDVIILTLLVINYDKVFSGFNFKNQTFMQNVKEKYLINDLSSFQIEKKINNQSVYEFSSFSFTNISLYDYLKKFFKGGLNFYNSNYISRIVDDVFSIDINSSYPSVMYKEKYPKFIYSFSEKPKILDIKNDYVRNNDLIYYFQFDKIYLNHEIISKIDSTILKQMIVKYYREDVETNTVFISSIILNTLFYDFNIKIDLSSIKCESYISYTTDFFGARDIISELYYIKTQGKQKFKLIYNSPIDISLSKEKNDRVFSDEEIYISKVYLNGIYGLPALRKYFDYFYISDDNLIHSLPNGFENNERNILFSATVTMYAFRNLINPLKYFKENIDDYFIYCDTDSLYLKLSAFKEIPKSIYHKMNLGFWDIEHPHIKKFFVLNHKKYCYLDEKQKIQIRSAGVTEESFNRDCDFETFIDRQFSNGVKVPSKRSILNKDLTISIYESETEFKEGDVYPLYYFTNVDYKDIEKQVTNHDFDESNVLLFMDSPLGAFTKRDFEKSINDSGLEPIENLIKLEKYFLRDYL